VLTTVPFQKTCSAQETKEEYRNPQRDKDKMKCSGILLPEDNHNKTISQQKKLLVVDLTAIVQVCHNCILAVKSN